MNTNVVNVLTKAVGITGLGLVAYDSHTAGKIESSSYQKQVKASSITNTYMDTLTLDSPSIVQSKVKNKFFKLKTDENLSDFFTGIIGYAKGFASMTVSSIIPLALSLGTLVKSKTSAIGKMVSRASAVGLVAYCGIFLGREVMGIGKPKALSEEY
jgi:hypothetical protein